MTRSKVVRPFFFEKMVIDLLIAMGYGKEAITKSLIRKGVVGEIDGVIIVDQLGLDVVCIQAKK